MTICRSWEMSSTPQPSSSRIPSINPVQHPGAGDVDALGRLVKHQQVGPVDHRAGQQQALQLAARQGGDRRVAEPFETHRGERGVDLGLPRSGRSASPAGAGSTAACGSPPAAAARSRLPARACARSPPRRSLSGRGSTWRRSTCRRRWRRSDTPSRRAAPPGRRAGSASARRAAHRRRAPAPTVWKQHRRLHHRQVDALPSGTAYPGNMDARGHLHADHAGRIKGLGH